MPSTRDLRRRIKSIKNTSQITKAMQMVSATKMRRSQSQALGGRPYRTTLDEVMAMVSGKINPQLHPLLQNGSGNKRGFLILSSDKGLCGALNTNIIRTLQSNELLKGEVQFYTVGKKVRDYLVRSGKEIIADFENTDKIDFSLATQIRKMIVGEYLSGKISEVYIIYPDFISTLRQEPKILKLLPIEPMVLQKTESGQEVSGEFLFEPNVDEVLDYALVHWLDTEIYQALLETKASEHSARMMAMQNATDNAIDLVGDLNLTYNQIRQNAITTELLEITTAGAALE